MLNNMKFTDKQIETLLGNITILIDKRDKPDKNTHITGWLDKKKRGEYERVTLSNGDYSCKLRATPELGIMHDMYFDKEFVIERKANWEEISTNFTKKRGQFEQELSSYNGQLIIMIEDSWDRLFLGTYDTSYNRISFIATVMTFWNRYNVPFTCQSKESAGVFIYTMCRYFVREKLK